MRSQTTRPVAAGGCRQECPGHAKQQSSAKCLETDPAKRYQKRGGSWMRIFRGVARPGRQNPGFRFIARLRMNRIRELPWQRLAITGALIVAIAAGICLVRLSRGKLAAKFRDARTGVGAGGRLLRTTRRPGKLDNTLEPMLGLALEAPASSNAYKPREMRGSRRRNSESDGQARRAVSAAVARSPGTSAWSLGGHYFARRHVRLFRRIRPGRRERQADRKSGDHRCQ